MSEERRIVLWRRALFLFRKFTDSEGPFHKAGFEHFRIEQKIVGLGENKPDIIGWRTGSGDGGDRALILELTLNDKASKSKQLERYRSLGPNQLNPLGISASEPPDVALGIPMQSEMDKEYCHIVLGESLSAEGVGNLRDEPLRKALSDSEGLDLVRIPATHFSVVPESKFMEIRRGIAPIILQRFAPSAGPFTAEEVADLALDFLGEHMDSKVRDKVVVDVRTQIENLANAYLKDYIEVEKGGTFKLTEKGKAVHSSPGSMEKVNRQVNAWMHEKSLDTYFEQVSKEPE